MYALQHRTLSPAGGTLLHLVAPSCNNLFRNARDVLVFKVTMDVVGVIVSSVFLGAAVVFHTNHLQIVPKFYLSV